MNEVYLLTGGNLGDRPKNLALAQKLIEQKIGAVAQVSSLYETAAWGVTNQPSFLNQVLRVTTAQWAEEVLQNALLIEESMGRKRLLRFGARTIDIDILLFNQAVIDLPNLTVPHPAMAQRRFVLTPLAEIAPQYYHPVLRKTIHEMLIKCPDQLDVNPFLVL